MGITTGQLRKLGFNINRSMFRDSDDVDTLSYRDHQHNLILYLPKGKKVIFISEGYNQYTGEPKEIKRFLMLDEVGYFEFQRFLRSLKRENIDWPKNTFIE